MKIGNPADKRIGIPAETTPAKPKDEAAKAAANKGAADPSAQVKLSDAAATLMSGADAAEFDAAKVERISQSIADGSYKVNAELIADKLIANAKEVLGKVQR